MKFSHFTFVFVLAAAMGLAALPAQAQVTTGTPITVRVKTRKPPKPKTETFKGEVVYMNAGSISVRDPKNTLIVRTFTYSAALKKKLQTLIARGGYQFGDKVQIRYVAGSSVAEGIKGKASKPF